jgi:hypothetical protein
VTYFNVIVDNTKTNFVPIRMTINQIVEATKDPETDLAEVRCTPRGYRKLVRALRLYAEEQPYLARLGSGMILRPIPTFVCRRGPDLVLVSKDGRALVVNADELGQKEEA